MKTTSLLLLSLIYVHIVSAQVIVTPGAQLSFSVNAQVKLDNMNFVNNGSFLAGFSNVFFTGNAASTISGSQPIQFYSIEINKTGGTSVSLLRAIGVSQTIQFTTGFLNLTSFDADLGSTGILNNEQENTRVIAPSGGRVIANAVLNAPASANPGNLGALITSSQNLGNTIIRRGHKSQASVYGTGNSVNRFYEIIPTNNTALNATLRFQYFDAELNGLTEGALVLWKTPFTNIWTNIGFNTRSTATNYVEKSGVADLSRITLSTVGNALPVHFALFNVSCQDNMKKLVWKTAQEQNTLNFQVQRSDDGSTFTTIAIIPASGNSNTEKTYTYSDNALSSNTVFYRIAETDIDGRMQYTPINRIQCGNTSDEIKAWPNPVGQLLFVNVTTATPSPVIIKLYDSKGALVHTQNNTLLRGSNQLNVDMSRLAPGSYNMVVDWNDGLNHKTIKLVKQ